MRGRCTTWCGAWWMATTSASVAARKTWIGWATRRADAARLGWSKEAARRRTPQGSQATRQRAPPGGRAADTELVATRVQACFRIVAVGQDGREGRSFVVAAVKSWR